LKNFTLAIYDIVKFYNECIKTFRGKLMKPIIDLQWFTEVLTQEEIDLLLTPVNGNGTNINNFTIEEFEDFLLNRKLPPENTYGIFDQDITVCNYFSDKNENLLEDIKRKNIEQGYGNINIPDTDITLINYWLFRLYGGRGKV